MKDEQPRLKKWLELIWVDALEHAHLQADSLRLLPVKAKSFAGWAAAGYPPNQFVDATEHGLEFWNDVPQRTRFHRIVLPIWRSRPGIAGLVRHELEHVRQLESDPSLAALHADALQRVLVSGASYQCIPMEADANAAGSTFARARYGNRRVEERIGLQDRDCAVLRPAGPPDLATLSQRMRDFIAETS